MKRDPSLRSGRRSGQTVIFFLLWLGSACLWASKTPIGMWYSLDDHTHEKRALIQVMGTGAQLSAKIVRVFEQDGDTGVCSLCPGKFKDQPIQGLNFAWGFQPTESNVWTNGQILDPKNGKVYRANLTLAGDKLLVRGYIGIPLLGRTQAWERATSVNK